MNWTATVLIAIEVDGGTLPSRLFRFARRDHTDDIDALALSVLARQDGPTVLAGHSFSGMIVTDAGVHPNVSAVVYVAARAFR